MIKKELERDEAFAWEVLDTAPYAVLAMADGKGEPYCVPMSPARDGRTVYLHCDRVGEKLSLLKHNPKVALTAVSYYKAVSAEYTMSYASAVLRGQASIVEDDAERIRALRCISEKYSGADMDKFDAMVEKYAKAAHVIRIDVEQITGKETRNG